MPSAADVQGWFVMGWLGIRLCLASNMLGATQLYSRLTYFQRTHVLANRLQKASSATQELSFTATT